MRHLVCRYIFSNLSLVIISSNAIAATTIDLQQASLNSLLPYLSATPVKSVTNTNGGNNPTQLALINTHRDFNQVAHIRFQQTFKGYAVWGAEAVIHADISTKLLNEINVNYLLATKNGKMNGKIYADLEADLAQMPSYLLSKEQQAKSLQHAKLTYLKAHPSFQASFREESVKTIIYVNEKNKARYANLISFLIEGDNILHRPLIISDAITSQIYLNKDQMMHIQAPTSPAPQFVLAGGIGGYKKTRPKIYDGEVGNYPGFTMQKLDDDCVFANDSLLARDVAYPEKSITTVNCPRISYPQHPKVETWISSDEGATRWLDDEANGGYSPTIDAFFAGSTIQALLKNWYNLPLIIDADNKAQSKIILNVHYGRNFDGAFWDPQTKQVYIGDGNEKVYPFAKLDIVSHELGHSVTTQHSNINVYESVQMNALNESFSDMVAVVAKYYVTGQQEWFLGPEAKNKADESEWIRYLDDPTKANVSRDPEECLFVDHMKDFRLAQGNPNCASGIPSKAFYLIATSPNWTIRKAFDVMLKANTDYWNSSMKTFAEAACGVIWATKDYHYNLSDVQTAFKKVGIDTSQC